MLTRRLCTGILLLGLCLATGGPSQGEEPGGPLAIDLVVDRAVPRGDKTTYYLKATATGGAPPYYFSWQNATPNVGATVNPNTAVRTCLNSQSVTVKVWFTSAPWIYDTVTIGRGDL